MEGKSTVRVNPRVKHLAEALTISKDAIAEAANELDKVFRARENSIFASEGSARGSPWQELSKDYEKWKKKHYPGRKILQLTGQMREAFVEKNDPHHVVEYYRVTSWTIRLGVQGPRFWTYHHKGGTLAERPPRRDMLADDDTSRTALQKRLAETVKPRVMQQLRLIFQSGALSA